MSKGKIEIIKYLIFTVVILVIFLGIVNTYNCSISKAISLEENCTNLYDLYRFWNTMAIVSSSLSGAGAGTLIPTTGEEAKITIGVISVVAGVMGAVSGWLQQSYNEEYIHLCE